MRYYEITISDPNSGMVLQTTTGTGFAMGQGGSTFSSLLPNGNTNPSALQVEFDIPVAQIHEPQGQAYLRVWGIGLPMISQAYQLAGMNIVLKAGMKKGLPLANPLQSGIIVEGQIFQSFGNWEGVNQTLDIVFNAQGYIPPKGFSWMWKANTPIKQALEATINQAFGAPDGPGYTPNTDNISATIQQNCDDPATYYTFTAWAAHVQQITQPIGAKSTGNAQYPGVRMALNSASKIIYCYDNLNNASSVAQIAFQDLVGQPTWINPGVVNFKTVLRADLQVGNYIMFPQGIQAPFVLTQVAAPNTPSSDKSAFQGTFSITRVQHFANFRQPDAAAWNTTFDAAFINPPTPKGTGYVDLPGFYD